MRKKDNKIWLIIFIVPSKAKENPWSPVEQPMDFQEFSRGMNTLQGFDSFPEIDDTEGRAHRIVKKQMALSDYKESQANKGSMERNPGIEEKQKAFVKHRELTVANTGRSKRQSKTTSFEHKNHKKLMKPKVKSSKEIQRLKKNSDSLYKNYMRLEDKGSPSSYEWRERVKLRRKRCPQGNLFSQYLECLGLDYLNPILRKKRIGNTSYPKRIDTSDPSSDGDPEPANEWLDATQGAISKIPSEFKPKKKPTLKIFHLRSKRKPKEVLREKIIGKRRASNFPMGNIPQRSSSQRYRGGCSRKHKCHRHHPRSFLIHINKKEHNDQDEGIVDNDEAEGEEFEENDDDEEQEEEDEEFDDEDEEEAEEDEATEETKGSGLKEFLKSAKAAVTNRVKFNDGSAEALPGNGAKSGASKLTGHTTVAPLGSDESKTVLIDANIKVDGAIGNALKNILGSRKAKSVKKDSKAQSGGGYVSDGGSQDQLDPELMKKYESLIRSNPRVKKYFLSTRDKREE